MSKRTGKKNAVQSSVGSESEKIPVGGEGFSWVPLSTALPSYADFGSGLDEQKAFEHFGGLTLDQAYERLGENFLYYQEDFMFMGPIAFTFYFPVMERHVYSVEVKHSWDDFDAWIVAKDLLYPTGVSDCGSEQKPATSDEATD